VSPKVKVESTVGLTIEYDSLNVPASKVPGVFEPLPSQSPTMGTSGLVP
jgi:hypothetical protein